MRTKVMSWLLALCLMVGLLPATTLAAAAPGTSSGTVIYVSESGDDSAAGDENAPLKTIGAAFTKAADGDTICLLSDIQLAGKLVLTGDKSVTLADKAGETAKKITCQKASSSDDYMIEVGVEYGTATATNLTLENVTIDAEGQDIRCIRVCPESQLILENGATVCNGRAVHSDGSTGTNDWGGGVFLYGKGDSFYMTDGIISDNEAKQGGGISISDTDAAAYLLGGTIQDNKAIDGYPHVDDASERSYYGNAVYQDGSLYLDGTKANISGDIRIGCRFDTSGGISTNRFVALVGASDTMNDYELTSFESESLDGRVVVAPSAITYGTEAYSVADAEPYLAHFTHNHKEIITDTDYTAETGASSQAKSLVLYGAIQKYSVTYTDGIGGASFADEVTSDLRRGTPTPAFTGGTPTHSGYTFTGWSPAVAATVTANAVYTAQWVPIGGGGEDPYGNLTVSKTVTGKAGDTEQKFTFTVKLDRAISGAYGDMTFNNGTAVVTLKHGESSTATKLPADIHYTVTESDNDGYTVTANGATGVISDGKTAVAAFINTKDSDAPDQPSNPDSPVTPNQPGSPDVPNDSGTPDDVPKMGDTMNLGLWISLMELSLAGLFISLVVVKKRTRRNRHSN